MQHAQYMAYELLFLELEKWVEFRMIAGIGVGLYRVSEI